MLIFFLFTSTYSKLCSELTQSDLSESFAICTETLNHEHCEKARSELDSMLKNCLSATTTLSFSQKLNDFIAGFLNGIQEDPTSPSDCVVSIIELKKGWETLFNGLTKPQFATGVFLLFNVNRFVSELDSTYGLCSFSSVYDIFHPGTIPKGLNSIFTRWLIEKVKVKNTIKDIRASFDKGDYIAAGMNWGKLFFLLTGYRIDS